MSAKQFFKGKAFKCILTLLAILLVCGVLLTICSALFYVSPEEKLSRAISKIYGETVEYKIEQVDEDIAVTSSRIEEIYEITTYEGDYLVKVTGFEGYGGGTVTCWIRVNVKADSAEVIKISIDSNVNQSYISKVTGGALQTLVDKQNNDGFTSFNTDGISTGASYSMGAISNAANGALSYVKDKYLGIQSKFKGYQYADHIDEGTDISVSGTEVTYTIITNGLTKNAFNIEIKVDKVNGVITTTGYNIVKNGSSPIFPGNDTDYATKMSETAKNLNGKTLADIQTYLADERTKEDGGVLHTGATNSNTLCYECAAFALSNYDKALSQYSQGGNA